MILKNKIDFMLIFAVDKCNPNGDPINGNRPRQDINGYGEVSDVCLKRKIRNRLQDFGEKIIVQSNDRSDDGYTSIRKRAASVPELKKQMNIDGDTHVKMQEIACKEWIDVRAFGQVFAQKKSCTVSVRGPVSISMARSLEIIEIEELVITKSLNNDGDAYEKDSSTMGTKYIVDKGAYVAKGSIFPQMAEKTRLSEEDVEKIKKALMTLFEGDASSARPSGTMTVTNLFWWRHSGKEGKYSPMQVFRSVELTPQKEYPYYSYTVHGLNGLEPEIYTGY